MTPTPASQRDLFTVLLDQYTASRERERLLGEEIAKLRRLLLRVLEDDKSIGCLSPHSVEMARRVLAGSTGKSGHDQAKGGGI